MKKMVLSLLMAASFSLVAFSQLDEKMEKEGVVPGAIYAKGKETQGYIRKMGSVWTDGKTFPAPWQFQSDIKFVPKDVFEKNEKIKRKHFEEYQPKDIDGYRYDSLEYETVKYADMSAVGLNMFPKKMFMRRVIDDKISLFYYYNSPPPVVVGESFEPHYIECGKKQQVYRIGKDGKLRLLNALDIKDEMADCPYVVEKHEKGEYKFLGKEGKESSGANKLINNTLFREEVSVNAIIDYNKNCKE